MSDKLFDARCQVWGVVDDVFGFNGDPFRCAQEGCDGVAVRIISPVRCKLEGVSGDFPGAAMKWARDHERRAKQGGNS